MKKTSFFLSAAFLLAASSCPAADEAAVAKIRPTSDASKVTGTVWFRDTAEGLKVSGKIENAAPGKHGFHIHQFGDCSDSGKAAGDHYNPMGHPHGNVLKDGLHGGHAGDFGNLEVGADGTGAFEAVLPGLTLASGPHSIAGRAVVFHEKEDDFGQPAGNAGARVGCGEIVFAKGA